MAQSATQRPPPEQTPSAPLDVKAQAERLKHAFKEGNASSSMMGRATGAWLGTLKGLSNFKIAKIAVGIALIAICGIGPARRMFQDASMDAVVNAKLITIRSPIEGIVSEVAPDASLGSDARASEPLFTIRNARADHGRLDDLARELATARVQRNGLKARLAALRSLYSDLNAQVAMFTATKRVQLQASIADLEAQFGAAEATRQQAEKDLARAKSLAKSGVQAQTTLESRLRDATVATEASNSLKQRLVSARADLRALDAGYFVGDSYNDRPSSKQQADNVSIRIAETTAELEAAEASLRNLNESYINEKRRTDARSTAHVSAPGAGQIWDVLVSPGEEVARGQPLARILDCSSGLVTGTVRKSVYERLSIGEAAQFKADAFSKTYTGRIVRLSTAGSPEALAITSAGEGPYRVTVAVPELSSLTCGIGQSGRLVFTHGGAKPAVDLVRTSDLRGPQN